MAPKPVPRKNRAQKAFENHDSEVLITPCNPNNVEYVFEDGLRRVEPYHYTYHTNCKERWRGKTLEEMFVSEFRDRPIEYYRKSIQDGLILVNHEQSQPDTVLKNGDVITNSIHRHEPPVTAEKVGIVHEDEDMMVINKPAGVPVHPAGRYRFNSVVKILQVDMGFDWNPLPCNRLDRLTSGVMFIAKHPKAALNITSQIQARTVRKEYVARVRGRFPDGEIVCEQPMLSISPKYGLNMVRANGKDAKTVFKRIAYYPPKEGRKLQEDLVDEDGNPLSEEENAQLFQIRNEGYSIVKCLPLTGRTHQIRVHLQYLGHPITNDPIYANQRVWGFNLGKGGVENDEDIISRLSRMGKEEVAQAIAYHEELAESHQQRKAEKLTGEFCKICDTPLYSDPGVHELGIYLHARRYGDQDGKWSYETSLPAWALPPVGETSVKEPELTMEPDVVAMAEEISKISVTAP